MWKKEEESGQNTTPRQSPSSRPERSERRAPSAELATIGSSITIKGEVSGDEDLLIQGRIEGSVELKEHAVIVGSEGEVEASITARTVTVEGTVNGDLTADEQIILRNSAKVKGDIAAPRVVLEDGARFRGGVDMGEPVKPEHSRPVTTPASKQEPEGQKSGKDDAKATGDSSGKSPEAAPKIRV